MWYTMLAPREKPAMNTRGKPSDALSVVMSDSKKSRSLSLCSENSA